MLKGSWEEDEDILSIGNGYIYIYIYMKTKKFIED